MQIKDKNNLITTIVCLPWLNKVSKNNLVIFDTGSVSSWDTDLINTSNTLNLRIVIANVTSVLTSHSFHIKLNANVRICPGDSGSGFIKDCDIYNGKERKKLTASMAL